MDFAEWSERVLHALVQEVDASPQTRLIGAGDRQLGMRLFADRMAAIADFHQSPERMATLDALEDLQALGLVERPSTLYWKLTEAGRQVDGDPLQLWQLICQRSYQADWVELLRVVNAQSAQDRADFAEVRWLERSEVEGQLGWTGAEDLLWAVAQETENVGLVRRRAAGGGYLSLRSTYRGLVWQTRRAATVEAQFIDRLLAEWETTSVEFKREVHTGTADQKAELIKDILGLANTQATGQRWLIIGFDDKTRTHSGPPDPKLTQNHLEQLAARYTEPCVELKYDTVDYHGSLVGRLEVVREAHKLPYKVAKAIGDKKRVVVGDVYVRHSSQTERPSAAELGAIQEEGDRARGSA